MSNHLPQELCIQILLLLPIKTLIQCTCVCKSWNSIIKSTNFITTHLNLRTVISNSINNKYNLTDLLLFRHYYTIDDKYSLHHDNETLDEYAKFEDFLFWIPSRFFRILGSCNGLLCLTYDCCWLNNITILYNPSIRKSVTLPYPGGFTFTTHGPHFLALAFGFDEKTNDYKVVRLCYAIDNDGFRVPPEAELYSLRLGSWRRIDASAVRLIIPEKRPLAYINGAVHWIAYADKRNITSNLILSFDIVIDYDVERRGLLLGDHKQFCSIWVLKEYGVVESWSKLFTIDLRGGLNTVVKFRNNGEILMGTKADKLVSYQPETQRVQDIGIRGPTQLFYVDTYMESLVLIDRVNEEDEEEEEEARWMISLMTYPSLFSLLIFIFVTVLAWSIYDCQYSTLHTKAVLRSERSTMRKKGKGMQMKELKWDY